MMNRRNFIKVITAILLTPFIYLKRKNDVLALDNYESSNVKNQMNGKMNKVITIKDERATNWNYNEEKYLDYIDYSVVDDMVDEGILKLAGTNNLEAAWNIVIRNYNEGDIFAIKPNFNNINHWYKKCFTSPHVINSVVRSLVQYLNVREKDVYIYDLCKKIPKELIRDRIKYNVNYIERFDYSKFWDKVRVRLNMGLASADRNAPIKMRNDIIDDTGNKLSCYIPKVLTRADHLINISLLTNHIFVPISGPLKNHFGTVRFSNYKQYPECLHGDNIKENIEDINSNEHIISKTRLYICDGLFGIYARGEKEGIHKWETYPCEHGTPNTLLFSFDPVSMEKMIKDIVVKERKIHNLKLL